MTYDPDIRRTTPLAEKLAARIGWDGPITLRDYMTACLYDAEHGYYRNREAIGLEADFITAPEISQIFGELIGLWCAVVWQQMGSPTALTLAELGPGRGTLMRDMLRATQRVDGFHQALRIVLVETNETLAEAQRRTLADSGTIGGLPPVTWSPSLEGTSASHGIVIGNEFLDCLPVAQFVRSRTGWFERRICLDDHGRLQFEDADETTVAGEATGLSGEPEAAACQIAETIAYDDLVTSMQRRFETFAALFIDYGDTASAGQSASVVGRPGDTLQALRHHRYEHPLTSPGEADLTAHVDFSGLQRAVSRAGLICDGVLTQSEFLGRLGIVERASRLMAANPDQAGAIEAGAARLIAPGAMGSRFKAAGFHTRDLRTLPAFEADAGSQTARQT